MTAFAPGSWYFERDGNYKVFKQMTIEKKLQNFSSNTFSAHFTTYKPYRAWNVMSANSILGKNKLRVNLLSYFSIMSIWFS